MLPTLKPLVRALAFLLVARGASLALASSEATFRGAPAMPGVPAKVNAVLRVDALGPTQARFDLTESKDGHVLTGFDVDMTKKLHMIVVSDDLVTFLHIHPALASDGRFTIDVNVPAPGHYLVYADAEPTGIGRQVFRFDVPFGTAPPRRPRLAPTPDVAVVGPYTVRFDSLHLAAGSMTMLNVRITKDGKPANDLHPYLGGAAHAVFINAGDYAYLHVHPMAAGDMSSMSAMGAASEGGEMRDLPPSAKVSPQMMLHVTAPAAGTYKLWLQFRGGSALYVAPFVLTAS